MSVATVNPIAGPYPKTTEWESLRLFDPGRERPVIFGASEAASLLGVSKYATPFELYLYKRGEMSRSFSEQQKQGLRLGLAMEPVIIGEYEHQFPHLNVTSDVPMYFHPEELWMAATPDGVVDHEGYEFGLECKRTTFRMHDSSGEDEHGFGKPGTDQLPVEYIAQGQHQMEVMGWDRVDFPVLFDGAQLRVYTVNRDEPFIDALKEAGREMAERVLASDPPEPTWSAAGTAAAIRAQNGISEGDHFELDQSVQDMVAEYHRLHALIKENESDKTEARNRIFNSLRGAKCGLLPDGRKVSATDIGPTYFTSADVDVVRSKVGQLHRKGYSRLNIPKPRKGG